MIPEHRFHVEPADYQADLEDLRTVRETVFVLEQQVPIEEEWDDLDPKSRHVLARDAQGCPIGTARLTPERKIGRMAVLKEWRGQGVGEALLRTLLEQARALHWDSVSLNAQVAAMDFYAKAGFEPFGERFMEAGIEHQAMRLTLPAPAPVPRAPSDLPPSEPARAIESLTDCLALLPRIIEGARNELMIASRDLDPRLLGHPEVIDALRRFATGRRGASVRIILIDLLSVQDQGHPLLALAQRMPSVFHLRTPEAPEDQQNASAYVVSDRGGFLYRGLASRYDGEGSPCLPARARQLIGQFEPVWERSRPCTEFRSLSI